MKSTHSRKAVAGLVLAGAALAVSLTAQQKKQPEIDLQAAIRTETVDGNLNGAIKQYGVIVAKYKDDRAVTAMALVHMAECHQKLGDAESHKIYEQVVREYADQKEAVTIARARLGGAESTTREGGITLRKVWTGDTSGTISPDGRRLTLIDWVSPSTDDWGRLLLHDVVTGTDRPLTSRKEGHAFSSAISRDGTQVAYSWSKVNDGGAELRITSLLGNTLPQPRRLLGGGDLNWIGPYDWSPDGKWIAVLVNRKDHTAQIGLVAVPEGSLRVLKSVDWRGPTKIAFSPDGRDLAFDLPVSEASENRDVFVLAIDGSREVPAVVHPSNDVAMGWSPDGKHLLFASDRSGSTGVWALAFAGGKPQGAPELVKANIGSPSWSMGLTTAGALYLGVKADNLDIEVASIDLETGKQTAPPVRPIQSFTGSNTEPAWSRDGKYIAYASSRGPAGENIIGIRSVDTGGVRELQLQPRLRWIAGLSWAPDDRSFAVFATDLKGRDGVFRIDVHTGAVVPIVVPTPERLSYEGFFWSPDGKRIYYHSQKGGVYERELGSGNDREVIRGQLGPISLSPDGRWIASAKSDPATKSQTVVLIPVEGGEPREMLRVSEPQWINNTSMAWTPDGRAFLVRKMLAAGGKTSELWLVPVADKPPRKLDFDVNRVAPYAAGKLRLHPDGRQVAYVSGRWSNEVWVLENFLPTLKASR
jgi:Tol biopolymer transport system component